MVLMLKVHQARYMYYATYGLVCSEQSHLVEMPSLEWASVMHITHGVCLSEKRNSFVHYTHERSHVTHSGHTDCSVSTI